MVIDRLEVHNNTMIKHTALTVIVIYCTRACSSCLTILWYMIHVHTFLVVLIIYYQIYNFCTVNI